MSRQTKAYLYGGAAVLLWSTVASAFKLSLRHLEPIELLLIASGVSALTLLVLAAVRGRLGELRTLGRGQWWSAAGLGLLNPFLYYLVLFEAYDRLPAQEAQPLNYTWALTLALLSIPLLKQRIGWRDIGGILVSYCGVMVIATRGQILAFELSDPVGVGLALGSTIIWALYWIYNTKGQGDPVLRLMLGFGFGFVYVLVAAALLGKIGSAHWDWRGWLGGAYVGVFEMGVTFALWLTALRHSENTAKVANLIFLSPFLSLVFIYFLVGEAIAGSTMVGLVFIVGGILVQQLGRKGEGRSKLREGRSQGAPSTTSSRGGSTEGGSHGDPV